MQRRKLFFLFIDGIGFGPRNNPISGLFSPFTGTPVFSDETTRLVTDTMALLPLDTCLGVPGLPQSATGQTTIMTGINAPQLLGYHLIAFPNRELLPVIQEYSLLKKLNDGGIPVTSANLYSPSFFEERKKRHRNMLPVSSLSIEAAGIPFRFIEDYRRGKAVSADITNAMLIERGYEIDPITPLQASERINRIFETNDFVFFEYFLTDTFGHARDEAKLRRAVAELNQFMEGIWKGSSREIDILVTSDHGNAEDTTRGDHSLNPVPFFLLSGAIEELRPLWVGCRSLLDVYPFITRYFGVP